MAYSWGNHKMGGFLFRENVTSGFGVVRRQGEAPFCKVSRCFQQRLFMGHVFFGGLCKYL